MLDRLKHHLDVDPFVPFRLVATSGTTYDVQSSYQIAIGETLLEYFYPKSDRIATIRLNQLVGFETLDAAKS
jgi:hypothetical protein